MRTCLLLSAPLLGEQRELLFFKLLARQLLRTTVSLKEELGRFGHMNTGKNIGMSFGLALIDIPQLTGSQPNYPEKHCHSHRPVRKAKIPAQLTTISLQPVSKRHRS